MNRIYKLIILSLSFSIIINSNSKAIDNASKPSDSILQTNINQGINRLEISDFELGYLIGLESSLQTTLQLLSTVPPMTDYNFRYWSRGQHYLSVLFITSKIKEQILRELDRQGDKERISNDFLKLILRSNTLLLGPKLNLQAVNDKLSLSYSKQSEYSRENIRYYYNERNIALDAEISSLNETLKNALEEINSLTHDAVKKSIQSNGNIVSGFMNGIKIMISSIAAYSNDQFFNESFSSPNSKYKYFRLLNEMANYISKEISSKKSILNENIYEAYAMNHVIKSLTTLENVKKQDLNNDEASTFLRTVKEKINNVSTFYGNLLSQKETRFDSSGFIGICGHLFAK